MYENKNELEDHRYIPNSSIPSKPAGLFMDDIILISFWNFLQVTTNEKKKKKKQLRMQSNGFALAVNGFLIENTRNETQWERGKLIAWITTEYNMIKVYLQR